MNKRTFPLSLASLLLVTGCKTQPNQEQNDSSRRYQLSRMDNTVVVQPELQLVHNANDKVVAMKTTHSRDFADQMLRWSGRR